MLSAYTTKLRMAFDRQLPAETRAFALGELLGANATRLVHGTVGTATILKDGSLTRINLTCVISSKSRHRALPAFRDLAREDLTSAVASVGTAMSRIGSKGLFS